MPLQWLESEAFPFGPGLFETMRLEEFTPIRFAEHWNRIQTSCKQLDLPYPFSSEETLREINQHARKLGNHAGRMRFFYRLEGSCPVLSAQFLTLNQPPSAWSLLPVTVSPHPHARHKITDRKPYEDLHDYAVKNGADDALFVTEQNEILETSRANIFLLRNEELYTPPLDGRILPGIMRSEILRAARQRGISVHETRIQREDLEHADTVFITNSVIGFSPVYRIIGFVTCLSRNLVRFPSGT